MPQVFGWQHIVYLLVFVAIAAVSLFFIKKYCVNKSSLTIAVKTTAALLLALITWNRICIVISSDDLFMIIPNTFCGTTSFVFALAALLFKQDHPTLHCFVYCGFIGGLITIIYPDFLSQNQSFFYPNTISGLLHHSVSLYLAVLMLVTGWIKPNLSKWKYFPIGLALMMVYGLFLLTASGRLDDPNYDAMYIKHPLLEGTPFTWYFVGALLLLLHVIFLLCMTYIPEYVNKKKRNNATS